MIIKSKTQLPFELDNIRTLSVSSSHLKFKHTLSLKTHKNHKKKKIKPQ